MKARWKTLLYAASLAAVFSLAGCEGDDGAPGADGAAGQPGPIGPPGPEGPPGTGIEAVDAAKPESCATCHGGVGEFHQAEYDKYVDASALTLTFNGVSTAAGRVTATFTITKNGAPFVDAANLGLLDQKRFYTVQYFAGTREYLNSCSLGTLAAVDALAGQYSASGNCAYAPEDPANNAQVYGYIADTPLFHHEGGSGSEIPATSHVHLYDNVANATLAFGDAQAADPEAYVSQANVAGCEKCHGVPYMKHGYRAAVVEGVPDFAACKSCHYDNRNGGHQDWQYMVDDPLSWATAAIDGAIVRAEYAYTANLMNDVHMSHGMEFPYPMSMANCVACHEGKLDLILDNSNFTPETCKSCHPYEGINAKPGEPYEQPNRATPFRALWTAANVGFHGDGFPNCQDCHNATSGLTFDFYHNGYDPMIRDVNGVRYDETYTATINDVSIAGTIMTIDLSISDAAMNPHVYVSFYGWDTKNFIVPSHTRDANRNRFEFSGTTNVLFPTFVEVAPLNFELTVDLAAWVGGDPGTVPDLIAAGTIRKAEVTIAPRLTVAGTAVSLDAVTQTFDIGANAMVENYFKGTNAIVDTDKCDVCHDQLASTFHGGAGRGGDIVACRNCHNPTYPGGHIEMASRSIENYVHAIHSFQAFDVDEFFHDDAPEPEVEGFDPVLSLRYDQHIKHTFPNFTIRNCEACHNPGTYEVPDQTQTMPGLLSGSKNLLEWYTIVPSGGFPSEIAVLNADGRNISGSIGEKVVGPASRACGGCHRADFINADAAGDLASFNAHTEAFGTYVDNDDADVNLFAIIDKIMTLFE